MGGGNAFIDLNSITSTSSGTANFQVASGEFIWSDTSHDSLIATAHGLTYSSNTDGFNFYVSTSNGPRGFFYNDYHNSVTHQILQGSLDFTDPTWGQLHREAGNNFEALIGNLTWTLTPGWFNFNGTEMDWYDSVSGAQARFQPSQFYWQAGTGAGISATASNFFRQNNDSSVAIAQNDGSNFELRDAGVPYLFHLENANSHLDVTGDFQFNLYGGTFRATDPSVSIDFFDASVLAFHWTSTGGASFNANDTTFVYHDVTGGTQFYQNYNDQLDISDSAVAYQFHLQNANNFLTCNSDFIITNQSYFPTAPNAALVLGWATAGIPAFETDPVFTAWLAGPPNVSAFKNDVSYLTAATGPFKANATMIGGVATVTDGRITTSSVCVANSVTGNLNVGILTTACTANTATITSLNPLESGSVSCIIYP